MRDTEKLASVIEDISSVASAFLVSAGFGIAAAIGMLWLMVAAP